MSTCLENIVTLGTCGDDSPSTSGFQLIQAAGISTNNLNDTANENYVKGTTLALSKKALTLTQITNDFIGLLTANKIASNVSNPIYDSSQFSTLTPLGVYAGERGLTIFKSSKRRGRLSKIKITDIEIYSLTTENDVPISIYGLVGSQWCKTYYTVNLTANMINTISVDYIIEGDYARVLMDNTNVNVASSKLMCMVGCGGALPNECGYTLGFNGTADVKGEGYGLNAKFQCYCDYEQVICDMAKNMMGELIWLKWQINIFEEQIKSNRFSSLVIYNRDELKDTFLPDLEKKYTAKWNVMVGALFNILNSYRDDCLICRNVRWQNNV